MALTGQDIIDRARYKSNDDVSEHWGNTEALKWVNDAQRAVVSKLSKAGATSAQAALTAGSRQTLVGLGLTRGLEFLDVVCNVTGSTRTTPIRRTARSWLDDNVPNWHGDTSGPVEYWVYDNRDPTAIYLWPNPGGGAKIEVIYAALPTDLAGLADPIGIADVYAEAMQYHVLFSFFSKDITKLKATSYMQTYYQLFLNTLGIREQGIKSNSAEGAAKEQGAVQ